MIIKQIINNNVVSTQVDGEEVIIFGKGIGYEGKVGQQIDRSKIEKTYVLINPSEGNEMYHLLQEIPYDVIKFGLKASEYISDHLSKKISKRILIPLTDHIYASLLRYEEKGKYEPSLSLNVSFLYSEEYGIAVDIVRMINEEFNVGIGDSEANFIALHIVNSELDVGIEDTYKVAEIVDLCVKTVEDYFKVRLDSRSIEFGRFLTHLQFFAQRMIKGSGPENGTVDETFNKHLRFRYPKAYKCAREIGNRVRENYDWIISEEEYTYLTIHIARLLK